MRKQTVIIQLDKDLSVEVKGTYFGGRLGTLETPPEDSEFEVEEVNISTGSITGLLEYVDGLRKGETIFEVLSDKAIEQMQQDRYEAKMDNY
jgi:hypothetical protein